ncbi:MAG: hypothetical protein IPL00_19105 [Gammaproteobacteria bacterium]|nr:hypothetical protein [Gammaproteobacteria bacterium]
MADYNGAVIDAVKQTADALTSLRTQEQASEQASRWMPPGESFRLAQIRYRNGLDAQLDVYSTPKPRCSRPKHVRPR